MRNNLNIRYLFSLACTWIVAIVLWFQPGPSAYLDCLMARIAPQWFSIFCGLAAIAVIICTLTHLYWGKKGIEFLGLFSFTLLPILLNFEAVLILLENSAITCS